MAGSPSDVASVTVRVYQQGTSSPGLVAALQQAVAGLLEGSGFGLALIDCDRRSECRKRLTNELVLRIVPGRHPTNPKVCGDAAVGSGRQRGVLMTVYGPCVTQIADELRWRAVHPPVDVALLMLTETDVLAPIVVHEVIHLLLPGEVHGAGIWKAVLDLGDWERVAHGHLKLESTTAIRLREVLGARGGERTGAR